ncbi:MAG: type II toxin-antitoxin system HicA family toxin [Deltaproteobacteria bacterium]|nr:type II toxin-antitoxin system HicA family toxin [Deltaproteobacteria bacterium]
MGQTFPSVDYYELVKFFNDHNIYFFRQAKGSHEVWKHSVTGRKTTVVNHGKETYKRKTLKKTLEPVGLDFRDIIEWRKQG